MSKLGQLRRRVHYETDVPRCSNCTSYRRPGQYLRDSLPRQPPAACKLHAFTVKPDACCDRWTGHRGETLL